MGFGTSAKAGINRALRPFNFRIDSLTEARIESGRLADAIRRGQFEIAQFPPLPFSETQASAFFEQVRGDAAGFSAAVRHQQEFTLDNDYFSTPDAEVLYSVAQKFRPARVVEVGSGNSTLLFRLAAVDAGTAANITSIDPFPRRCVEAVADNIIRSRVELLDLAAFAHLQAGDILFVDSSHEVRTGNDVLFIFFRILPMLSPGVVIHFHDIFLPYDYPETWVVEKRWNWTEQYLLQAFLTENDAYEVIWPGHYLQRNSARFHEVFPALRGRDAKSFWMVKR
jgi:predicted O-methyltransferase YrrM